MSRQGSPSQSTALQPSSLPDGNIINTNNKKSENEGKETQRGKRGGHEWHSYLDSGGLWEDELAGIQGRDIKFLIDS